MAAAKKTAGKKSTGTSMVAWDAELAQFAQQGAEKEKAPVGKKVSFKGGVLSIGGQPIKGNAANVIILDATYLNAMYEPGVKYDPNNPSPPICYAINKESEEMAPHEESSDKQNDACDGCPNNAFKSGENGKGKACKNNRRIAIIASADTVDGIDEQEIFYADIPTMSAGGYALYVKGLNAHFKRPPWAMITEMSVVPDPKSQFRVMFNSMEPISDGKLLSAIKKRVEALTESNEIAFPFAKPAPQAKEQRGRAAPSKASKFAAKGGAKGRR